MIALCTTCTLYLSIRDLYFNFKAFDSTYLANIFHVQVQTGESLPVKTQLSRGENGGVGVSGTKINTVVTDSVTGSSKMI